MQILKLELSKDIKNFIKKIFPATATIRKETNSGHCIISDIANSKLSQHSFSFTLWYSLLFHYLEHLHKFYDYPQLT